MQEVQDLSSFSTFKEKLECLKVYSLPTSHKNMDLYDVLIDMFLIQRTEYLRVCFGKSGIHGWGLFARRKIQEEEMVLASTLLWFYHLGMVIMKVD